MEEEKNVTVENNEDSKEVKKTSSKKESTKKTASKSKAKKSLFNSVRGEFRKIIWMPKDKLVSQTATVIVVSAFFGLVIFSIDSLFNLGYSGMFNWISGLK